MRAAPMLLLLLFVDGTATCAETLDFAIGTGGVVPRLTEREFRAKERGKGEEREWERNDFLKAKSRVKIGCS